VVTEAQARQIIGIEGARVLVEIITSAWKDHIDEGRPRGRRTRADIVWEYMTTRADEELAAMEGVSRTERYGSPLYVLRDRMILRFKKHNQDFETRNYQTAEQRKLASQGHFDGLPDLPHVSCGYVLDAADADIDKLVVVRRVEGYVEWFIDLIDLASGTIEPATPIIPDFPTVAGEDIAPLPSIRIKRAEESGEDADS
jgi:hypothetical protein